MSIQIPVSKLTNIDRDKIAADLVFEKKTKGLYAGGESIYPYDLDDNNIQLPLNWTIRNIECAKSMRPKRDSFRKCNVTFSGKLRPLQVEVQKQAIDMLNKNITTILSLYTGAGKTITSIYIACKIKLPTLILVHRLVLMDQWKASIERVCDSPKIQIVKANQILDEECDFYLMNVSNVTKNPREYYKSIGFMIADEMHVMGTKNMTDSFLHIQPRYSLGLSATPYRSDGMDKLLFSFFGEEKIYRKLYRPHTVYRIKTNFAPEIERQRNGKVNWNALIDKQVSNEDRNNIILKIIKHYPDRTFLVLSKRVAQVEWLMEKMLSEGVSATSLVGVKKHFNYDSKVLVATMQKAGVGFDHPKLDTLIIASDVEEYFIQYLGRVFRREDSQPIIFDLVDENNILKSHYYTRRKVYLDHGGTVINKHPFDI